MTDASEWQGRMGDSWAEHWRRTDRSFSTLTDLLLMRSAGFAFSRVLDIGCGAGELSLALARNHPASFVNGVDISPRLVEVARERGSHLGNVAFHCADAASWCPDAGWAPDLLVSRHGVMFFDDSRAAFAHLAAIAAPGASLLFSCFRSPAENPVFTEVGRLLPDSAPAPGGDLPGPFRFADSKAVAAMLGDAGWSGIAFEPFDFEMIAGTGSDPVADAVTYFSSIGPAARAAEEMTPEKRVLFTERVREVARRHLREGIVGLRAAAWIVTARKG